MLVVGAIALLLVFSAVLVFARGLTHLAGEPRWPVSAAIAVAILIAAPYTVCRLLDSSFTLAVLLTGGLAAGGALALLSRAPHFEPAAPLLSSAPPAARAVTAVGFILVVWVALGTYFWDEHVTHYPVTNVIARGLVPPEHPFFPGEPFRYHFGFNVLSAEVKAFTGMPVATSIDVVAIGLYLLLLAAASKAGAAMAGRLGAGCGAILVPLAAGANMLLLRDSGPLEIHVDAIPISWIQLHPPITISHFFQHPMSVGMPFALAISMLFDGTDRSRAGRRRRVILGAFVLGVLSLGQLAFFAVLGLVLGIGVVARALFGAGVRIEPRPARGALLLDGAIELALLAGSVAIAFGLGGFFAPGGKQDDMLVFGMRFYNEPFLVSIVHHLFLFGLPLLLLPVAIVRSFRGEKRREPGAALRISLVVASVICFAIPNFVGYERSWDVVKFYALGAFFSALVMADTLPAILEPVRSRRARAALYAAVIAVTTASSWYWLVRMSIFDGRAGVPPMQFTPPPAVTEEIGKLLGPRVGKRDRVLSTNIDLASGTGFLTPGIDWAQWGTGWVMDRESKDEMRRILDRARHQLGADDLRKLGVRFIVLSSGDYDGLTPEAKTALEDPNRFTKLFDLNVKGDRRLVYEVVGAQSSSS